MCFNPTRVLAYEFKDNDGIPHNLILWDVTAFEYQVGLVIVDKDNIHRISHRMFSQMMRYNLSLPLHFKKRVELPCGKCLECCRQKADEWSVRCDLESRAWKFNYFVTLTYNDKNCPWSYWTEYGENEDDESYRCSRRTLKKSDLQSFMKHLRTIMKREYDEDNIRFFACGEYGSNTHRPHYHLILFNCNLRDLKLFKQSKTGHSMYRSTILERAWNKGYVTVQPYSKECARYVAQYTVKKLSKTQSVLEHCEPEFINMSRRQGIGVPWFLNNFETYITPNFDGSNYHFVDHIPLSRMDKGKVVTEHKPIPKSFIRRFKRVTNIRQNKINVTGSLGDAAVRVNDEYWSAEKVYYNLYKPIHFDIADALLDRKLSALGSNRLAYYGFDFERVCALRKQNARNFKISRDFYLTSENECDIIKKTIDTKRIWIGPLPNDNVITASSMSFNDL